jgi:hypothetical protein
VRCRTGRRWVDNTSKALPEILRYSETMVQSAVTSRAPVPTSSAGGSKPASSVASASDLIRRLHDRPDDFEATKALQELTALSRSATPSADPAAQDAIVRAGLSGVERMRRWVARRMR